MFLEQSDSIASADPVFLWSGQEAQSLGMSLRNLQRRLEEEGTSYRQALNDTRRDIARSYLDEGHTSVTEIAFLLGFADTSGFSRAFRRWTGLSPRTYSRHQAN